jgi:S-adenosylmethionine-diacylglycerol 3-amino-3-carboxypropyl transferase
MKNSVVDWGSTRLFNLVHQNNLVYNTCWEDPRVDKQALELTSDDTVFMITSAGCNALDYALSAPRKIHCVDMNPRQNALLELKQAGIRALDFDTFFSLFGKGSIDGFPKLYHSKLRALLSPSAQAQWDKQLGYFDGKGIRPSFYFRGTAGLFARMMNYYIDASGLREGIESIFHARTLADQRAVYDRMRAALWNRPLRWVMSLDATLSLLGVPRPQRKQVEGGYPGGISQFVEDCVESVLTRIPTHDNYFWWLYLTGSYSPDRCPEYLKPAGFQKLKSGLVDRIQVHTGTIADVLEENPEFEITRYVLLDHMDWLSNANHPVLEREWQAIVDRSAKKCRLLWRSGGLKVDFVDPIRVRIPRGNRRVGDILKYHTDWAAQLSRKDRVHTYGSFYIADLGVH